MSNLDFQLNKNAPITPNSYGRSWYILGNRVPSESTARWLDELKDGDTISITVRDYFNGDKKSESSSKKFKLVEIK